MRTLHKLTHRPLALGALFVVLGALGWQLPELGSAVLAYSTSAVKAARATLTSTPPASPKLAALTAAPASLAVLPGAAQSISQQLQAARNAFDAAVAAAKASPTKSNRRAVEAARTEVNRLSELRVAEIKAILSGASQNQGNAAARTDSAPGPIVPDYAALVAEMASLGGFDPTVVNAPPPNSINETEPNNTSATANTINVAAGAVAIASGAITPLGDEDFYKFTAPANSKVWIYVDTGGTLVSGLRDSQVDLFDTNGTTLIENDDDDGTGNGYDGTVETGFASAIAGRALTTAGDYFIRVREFDGTSTVNPYKLHVIVTTAATPVVAETEPNDTGATANVLLTAVQTTAIATGNAAANVDFYSITANSGDILYANLDGDPERDGVSTDAGLSLRDAAGTTIIVTSDSITAGTAANPTAENFGFLFTTSGTFTLRVISFAGQGTYNLMATLVTPAVVQTCPPTPITSNLGTATSNFPKVTGTQTQRLNRDGVLSACGVPRTQAAPIAGSFAFDRFAIQNSSAATACITISLRVLEQAASNYMVGAWLNTFNPANLTQNWLGDPGLSTGIPPNVLTFSVNVPAGQTLQAVVFNTNATGNGNPYELTILGFPTCTAPACVIQCPANITVGTAATACGANVTYTVPGAQPGSFCQTVTCTPASGSLFPKGVTTVTCTGTSPGNPNATCSFTVTVNDDDAPVITCPPAQFAGTTGNTAAVNYPLPTVTDNCPGAAAPVCTPAPGFAFPVGVTTVNCTVADAANNTASCSFTVTVNRIATGALDDPLACTGPGNVINGSFSVTNNGAVNQTVSATVTTSANLLVLPGTCVAAVGTCTVVNANTISYTATLTPGQSSSVSYKLQVNDGTPSGATLTSTVTASFNGGPPATAGASIVVDCPPPGPGSPFIGATAERLVMSDQRPGSVLIYPIYTSDAANGNAQNSRVSITNTHPVLDALVHLYFIDGSNCSLSDVFVCLTPNQTASFVMSDLDPGTTGYIIAVAVDQAGCPQHFNNLIGDVYVKFASGHQANLGAEAIPAIAGSGFWATCNTNSVTADLPFDGVTYGWIPQTLAVDSIPSPADGNNTLLIVDRIGGSLLTGPSRLSPLFGVLYDDAEIAYSFNFPSNNLCQFRTTLGTGSPRTTPPFTAIITAGRTGWMKLSGTTDIGIVGAVINHNPNATTNSGAFRGGHNLHKLTFTNTTVLVIPVFPPTC